MEDAHEPPRAGPDPALAPVLVVHGAATRDRAAFESEVARLAAAVGSNRPFVPVFWGDLARPAEAIDDVLPYLSWLGRAGSSSPPPEAAVESDDADERGLGVSFDADMVQVDDGEHVDDLDELEDIDERELDELGGLSSAADDPDEIVRSRRLRMVTVRDLERVADRIGANWRRQSAAARRKLIASAYRAVRAQYLAASARFAGDIILYQRRHREIQSRMWETIIREAPGFGLPESPVTVVTHSLGGTLAFDVAVAGNPRLNIDHLVSCACTAPYFHVIGCSPPTIAMHERGSLTTLPSTIGRWTNLWLPLDPWGYLAAPVFQLADGSRPIDIEVHAGEREDRILRHAASHYWRHPTVIDAIRDAVVADES